MTHANHPIQFGRSLISLSLIVLSLALPIIGSMRTAASSSNDGGRQQPDARGVSFKSMPLRFELNAGQIDAQVRFVASGQSGEMFLTPREMVLRVFASSSKSANRPGLGLHQAAPAQPPAQPMLDSAVVRLETVNANPNPRITGLDPLPGKTNYFIGNDPKKWHTDVPSFAKVKYENIYPGIDLIFYGNEGNLEYDFNVAPGADPGRIALSVEGTDGVRIDDAGDLMLRTAVGEVSQHAPHVYQEVDGRRQEIAGGYKLLESSPSNQNQESKIQNHLVAFDVANYDSSKPLVIDPELVYATYFGGSAGTAVSGLAVDAAGSVYVTGDTFAHDFPTKNPAQAANRHSGNLTAFVSKFSPDGQSLVYSTYLGGGSGFGAGDVGVGIAIDSTGAAYITGVTTSTDFPTRNAIQSQYAGGQDVFVTKLSTDGASLVYSTYLGGSGADAPSGIKLGATNSAFVYGKTSSTNFPTVKPTQATYGGGGSDGFWFGITPDGSQLGFSTYLGGAGDESISSFIVNSEMRRIYLFLVHHHSSSSTPSILTDLPDAEPDPWECPDPIDLIPDPPPVVDPLDLPMWIPDPPPSPPSSDSGATFAEGSPANPATLSRRAAQQANELEAVVWGSCIVAPSDSTCSGRTAFVRVNANTLVKTSVINITNIIPSIVNAVKDSQDALYVTGSAPTSPAFPLVNPIQSGGGGTDAYVTVFAPVTRQIVFSTYIGGSGGDFPSGIALDALGNIYLAGSTLSPNFPTRNAFQSTPPAPAGQSNGFIVKISAVGPFQTGPDFSLGFDSPAVTVQAGAKARITVNINRSGGFTGNVTVAPGLPGQGIRPKPNASLSTTDNSVTFKYKTGAAAPGQYPITFTGTDDSGKTRTATVTLIVQ